MPWKDIQEHLGFFLRPCVKGNTWISYITLGKTYCKSSKRLSVLETSLPCGLVVHINLVTACFVQASDDRLLKMRIDHHNQQLLRMINRLFPIIGTSLWPGDKMLVNESSDAENSRSACFDWHNVLQTGIKLEILLQISLFGKALFFKFLILTCLLKKISVSLWVPQISKINTANKSVESCRMPNKQKNFTE